MDAGLEKQKPKKTLGSRLGRLGRTLLAASALTAGDGLLNGHPDMAWAQITSGMSDKEGRRELRKSVRESPVEEVAYEIWAEGPNGPRQLFTVPPHQQKAITSVILSAPHAIAEIEKNLVQNEVVTKVRIHHTHAKRSVEHACAEGEIDGLGKDACALIKSAPPLEQDMWMAANTRSKFAAQFRSRFGESLTIEYAVTDLGGEWIVRPLTDAEKKAWPELEAAHSKMRGAEARADRLRTQWTIASTRYPTVQALMQGEQALFEALRFEHALWGGISIEYFVNHEE